MSATLTFTPDDAERPPHLGMAPLVDIVLLLICFYLFVMQSIQSRADETIELPRVFHAETSNAQPAELVLNLDAAGNVRLNGEDLSVDALAPALTAELARSVERQQHKPRVVIRADRHRPYEQLDALLDACRQAGLSAVTIRSTREMTR